MLVKHKHMQLCLSATPCKAPCAALMRFLAVCCGCKSAKIHEEAPFRNRQTAKFVPGLFSGAEQGLLSCQDTAPQILLRTAYHLNSLCQDIHWSGNTPLGRAVRRIQIGLHAWLLHHCNIHGHHDNRVERGGAAFAWLCPGKTPSHAWPQL